MKISGNRRKHCLFSVIAVIFLIFCFIGVSWGVTEGGHGEAAAKGWAATDTYRVMNFVVLAVALFILLRKPVSQLLKNRIKGIQEQLSDLEAKKKEAEKILAEYDERLMHLDQEAEKIVAEYVKQGEAAKARIIQEA
ncbi:ATP synthase F0 subunit B, partial [Thermodesulfobacteriota bacterium]